MRHLGIDFGTKKVGIALSDEAGTMGFPKGVLPNDNLLLDVVAKLIADERVERIVMGESRDYSGNENSVMKDARAFAAALTERTGVPVAYELEMLTTQEARRDFEGVHNAKSGNVDASAAAIILTSYLSHT